MYIIDKNPDYYDYFSHIYGEDKKIVYDRRGSTFIDDEILTKLSIRHGLDYDKEGHLILEIGDVQYLILIDNIETKKTWGAQGFVSCDMKIVRTFTDHKHYFEAPVSIRGCDLQFFWHWKDHERQHIYDRENTSYTDVIRKTWDDSCINNPILKTSQITGLLQGEEIWKELQNYISSLDNDTDVSIPMTDVQKAETHGFDKKTSFRHPIK